MSFAKKKLQLSTCKIEKFYLLKPLILETQYDIKLSDNEKKFLEETGILSENQLKKSGNDSRRTSLIIDQIVKLVSEGRKILVFAPSKQSSDTYSALLKSKNVAAESVTGETSFTDRQNSVLNFGKNKISVLINYNVFTTGFDDPQIDCIVIARPLFGCIVFSNDRKRFKRSCKWRHERML